MLCATVSLNESDWLTLCDISFDTDRDSDNDCDWLAEMDSLRLFDIDSCVAFEIDSETESDVEADWLVLIEADTNFDID